MLHILLRYEENRGNRLICREARKMCALCLSISPAHDQLLPSLYSVWGPKWPCAARRHSDICLPVRFRTQAEYFLGASLHFFGERSSAFPTVMGAPNQLSHKYDMYTCNRKLKVLISTKSITAVSSENPIFFWTECGMHENMRSLPTENPMVLGRLFYHRWNLVQRGYCDKGTSVVHGNGMF